MKLKIQVLCSFLLFVVPSFEMHQLRRHENEKLLRHNCSYEHINADVHILSSGSPPGGVVKIMTPLSHELHTVCYPTNANTSTKQAAMLSHAVCRQLGYMTYSSSYKHNFPTGIESKSVQANIYCGRAVQSLDDCSWCDLRLDNCSSVLATQCTTCHSIFEASEGFITNPGNPHVYIANVHCQWDIIVPDGRNILLTFRQFFLPESRWGSVRCEFGQSHVEITYGSENALFVQRYCKFNYVRTIKVPERKVTVRFYSGVDPGGTEGLEKEYGFNLLFQAEPMEQSPIQSFKFIVISGIAITVLVVMILCYCCRKIGAKYKKSQSFRRAASRNSASLTSEVRRAATFHQNPDFTGMMDKENVFVTVKNPYAREFGTDDETQAGISSEPRYQNVGLDAEQPCTVNGTPFIPKRERLRENGVTCKLKTSLLSRFAAISNSFRSSSRFKKEASPPVVIPQVTNFHIYNSFASKSTDSVSESLYECPKPLQVSEQVKTTAMSETHSESLSAMSELSLQSVRTFTIPTIVIECVDDKPVRDESVTSAEESQYLKPTS